MQFALTKDLQAQHCDTLMLGVYESGDFPPATAAIDARLQGAITAYLALKDFTPKAGTTAILYPANSHGIVRVILVGLGKADKLDGLAYQKIVRASAKELQKKTAKTVACFLPEIVVIGHQAYWKVRLAVETMADALYTFKAFKGKPSDAEAEAPATEPQVFFSHDGTPEATANLALTHGQAIAHAANQVRDLGNTPPNVCTPEYLADKAVELCDKLPHTSVDVLSETDMAHLGMGAFLAVTQGSEAPAQLVVIQYKGGDKHDQPIALIGKGITFDTGGISLKGSQIIMGMKYDMCGAATVMSIIEMAARLKLPLNIVALMACAENMPSGHATRPDDIVTTMSGKTVEIANTDAEGRLVLCDTITYAQKTFKPSTIIDVATLTGAVVVALGRHASAVFSNQQALADELVKAGQESLDRVWQMPVWEEYQPQLDSPFADIINVGGSEAGSITAACFLARFVDDNTPWAHLDVAGTAFVTGKDAHASGRPVSLLAEFLLKRANVGGI
ncbi:MAG: leucyl aminopeptidase [Gammaproteobacteria bacterium]